MRGSSYVSMKERVYSALIGAGLNATAQSLFEEKIDWTTVLISAVTGGMGAGQSFIYNLGLNTTAGTLDAARKGDNPAVGDLSAAVGTAFGFPLGIKGMQSVKTFMIPTVGQTFRRGTSVIPSVIGSFGSSLTQEGTAKTTETTAKGVLFKINPPAVMSASCPHRFIFKSSNF